LRADRRVRPGSVIRRMPLARAKPAPRRATSSGWTRQAGNCEMLSSFRSGELSLTGPESAKANNTQEFTPEVERYHYHPQSTPRDWLQGQVTRCHRSTLKLDRNVTVTSPAQSIGLLLCVASERRTGHLGRGHF